MFLIKNYIYIYMFTYFNILKLDNQYYYNNLIKKKIILIPIGSNVKYQDYILKLHLNNFIHYYKLYLYIWKNFLFNWSKFFVLKIRFRFKGGWIYIKKNKFSYIILEFGRSHRVLVFLSNNYVVRKKKLLEAHSLIVWGINLMQLKYFIKQLTLVREYGTYTLRGIRISRSRFYKRVGKISKYTMFKSKIF